MKWLLCLTLFFISCKQGNKPCEPIYKDSIVYIHDTVPCITSSTINCNAIQSKLDDANFKLQRVNYYVGICQRNSSQKQFLLGWIIRAIQ